MATEGTDRAGNKFLRLRPKAIVPVTIDLKLLPLKGSLYINEQLAVPFLVTNKGANVSTVTVTVRDDQNFVKTTTSLEYMLQPGQNTLGQFSLHAGSTVGVTSTVTVSASASAAADVDFQYDTVIVTTEERVVRKEDNTIPVCNITAVTGSCDVTMLDPCMCSQYNWSGIAEIQDDGFGLYLVTASVNTTGTFRHDPFSVGYNGTISATITSDCCHPLAYITVVDLASNTGQCVFYLAPRLTNYVHSFKPTTQCQTSSDWSTDRVIMAIAAQDAGLLVIVILIAICVVCVRGRNKDVQ
ncbi:uncharacterized protein [Haliotis cracherodii]|uniref:uncharacterized protein n=1 Tax=Haliotis cracherodii TaxID=6455 RepID=UPI0039E9D8D9